MVKIIEPGGKEFATRCSRCMCKFSYQITDLELIGITVEGVRCPECGNYVAHNVEQEG